MYCASLPGPNARRKCACAALSRLASWSFCRSRCENAGPLSISGGSVPEAPRRAPNPAALAEDAPLTAATVATPGDRGARSDSTSHSRRVPPGLTVTPSEASYETPVAARAKRPLMGSSRAGPAGARAAGETVCLGGANDMARSGDPLRTARRAATECRKSSRDAGGTRKTQPRVVPLSESPAERENWRIEGNDSRNDGSIARTKNADCYTAELLQRWFWRKPREFSFFLEFSTSRGRRSIDRIGSRAWGFRSIEDEETAS